MVMRDWRRTGGTCASTGSGGRAARGDCPTDRVHRRPGPRGHLRVRRRARRLPGLHLRGPTSGRRLTVEPVVLDTDVASLIIKRRLPDDIARLLVGRIPTIIFVTLAELARWVAQRQRGPRRRERLARWLSGKHLLHNDDDVARTWARSPPVPAPEAGHAQ